MLKYAIAVLPMLVFSCSAFKSLERRSTKKSIESSDLNRPPGDPQPKPTDPTVSLCDHVDSISGVDNETFKYQSDTAYLTFDGFYNISFGSA